MNAIAAFLTGTILLLLGSLILLMCLFGSASQEFQMGKISKIVGGLIGLFLILLGVGIATPA
jgi:threonine/homoserine/homoserine lactone efflux protein